MCTTYAITQTNFWFEAYVYNEWSLVVNTINNNVILHPREAAYKAATLVVDLEACFDRRDPDWAKEQFVAAQEAAAAVLAKAAPGGVTIYSGRCKWSPLFQKAVDAADEAVHRLHEQLKVD